MKTGLSGRYQLTVLRLDGSIKEQTPWFDNLITNAGLEMHGGLPGGTVTCWVGTGTNAPAITDTDMAAVAFTTSISSSNTTQPAPYSYPFWARTRHTCTFAIGAYVGTISEVGMGRGSTLTTFTPLYSRSLIQDELGNTTTITLGAIDQLIVTYDLYNWVTGQSLFNFNINGVSRSGIATLQSYYDYPNPGIAPIYMYVPNGSNPQIRAGTPIFEADFVNPSGGSTIRHSSAAQYPYVAGSYSRDFYVEWNQATGNCVDGRVIENLLIQYSGQWKISIEPPFTKTDLETFRLEGTYTWGRYTPS